MDHKAQQSRTFLLLLLTYPRGFLHRTVLPLWSSYVFFPSTLTLCSIIYTKAYFVFILTIFYHSWCRYFYFGICSIPWFLGLLIKVVFTINPTVLGLIYVLAWVCYQVYFDFEQTVGNCEYFLEVGTPFISCYNRNFPCVLFIDFESEVQYSLSWRFVFTSIDSNTVLGEDMVERAH